MGQRELIRVDPIMVNSSHRLQRSLTEWRPLHATCWVIWEKRPWM